MLTQQRLKEVLRYVKSTGLFYWRVSPKPGVVVGAQAGCLNDKGYVLIGVDGRLYRAHRLAWLYVTGNWPVDLIDHRNTNKQDNRWRNLRAADERLNRENRHTPLAHNTSGFLGVTWSRTMQSWQAQIKSHGRNKVLGYFKCPRKAHRAYVNAKRRLHAGCTI